MYNKLDLKEECLETSTATNGTLYYNKKNFILKTTPLTTFPSHLKQMTFNAGCFFGQSNGLLLKMLAIFWIH